MSSSSKGSKRKLNKTTGSNVKATIKAFASTNIEGPVSRTQRTQLVNRSRVPQHISRPPVARLSHNDNNLRIRPPHANILVTKYSKSIDDDSNNDFNEINNIETIYSDDNKNDPPKICTKIRISTF